MCLCDYELSSHSWKTVKIRYGSYLKLNQIKESHISSSNKCLNLRIQTGGFILYIILGVYTKKARKLYILKQQ